MIGKIKNGFKNLTNKIKEFFEKPVIKIITVTVVIITVGFLGFMLGENKGMSIHKQISNLRMNALKNQCIDSAINGFLIAADSEIENSQYFINYINENTEPTPNQISELQNELREYVVTVLDDWDINLDDKIYKIMTKK